MHTWLQNLPLFLAGVVQLIPVVGLGGQEPLSSLYGVRIDDPSTLVMMQHRAVLLGLVGLVLLLAIPFPSFRVLAVGVGLMSKLSYLALVWQAGEVGAPLHRVATVDLVTAILLFAAAASLMWERLGTESHSAR